MNIRTITFLTLIVQFLALLAQVLSTVAGSLFPGFMSQSVYLILQYTIYIPAQALLVLFIYAVFCRQDEE